MKYVAVLAALVVAVGMTAAQAQHRGGAGGFHGGGGGNFHGNMGDGGFRGSGPHIHMPQFEPRLGGSQPERHFARPGLGGQGMHGGSGRHYHVRGGGWQFIPWGYELPYAYCSELDPLYNGYLNGFCIDDLDNN